MSNALLSLFKKMLLIAAACASTSTFAAYSDCSGPLPLTVSLPAVSVPANLPVGQTIPGATATFAVPLTCTVNPVGDWYLAVYSSRLTLVPGFTDVYTTSGMTAGIGFRIRSTAGTVLVPFDYGAGGAVNVGPSQLGANVLQGVFELVKTGTPAVGSGGFPAVGTVNAREYANAGNQSSSTINFNYTILNNSIPSCSVTTTDVAVSMPYTKTSAFQGVGTTTAVTSLNLGMVCDANAHPSISFMDSANPSNQSNALTLAPGSTATGVGVQILYQSIPVMFSPGVYSYTTSNTPTTNGVALGTLSGTQTVPLQARYIQTGPSVTPGMIKAVATFTMNYN
ncbi:fimbrial protein [Paraburkholderia sp.]|uniref:fimbrial protein n=1 Tax=Paraburkholderia sp. TaxID=1926495 RepID=UPI002F3F43AF